MISFDFLWRVTNDEYENKAGYTAISRVRLGRGSNAQKSTNKAKSWPIDASRVAQSCPELLRVA